MPEDSDEEFEFYSGGKIDLGEMVAQHLGINIDPYPRKPDAALPTTEFGAIIEKPQPFASLAKIAKKQGKTEVKWAIPGYTLFVSCILPKNTLSKSVAR